MLPSSLHSEECYFLPLTTRLFLLLIPKRNLFFCCFTKGQATLKWHFHSAQLKLSLNSFLFHLATRKSNQEPGNQFRDKSEFFTRFVQCEIQTVNVSTRYPCLRGIMKIEQYPIRKLVYNFPPPLFLSF